MHCRSPCISFSDRATSVCIAPGSGREVYAPVDKQFQVGPYFVKVAFARALQNPVDEREKPRGYSRETAYIFFDGGVAYLFDLLFPFTHEHDRLVGESSSCWPKTGYWKSVWQTSLRSDNCCSSWIFRYFPLGLRSFR